MRPAPGHVAALLVLLGGCAKDAPQDYLQPEGPIAREAHEMFSRIVWFSVVPVLVVVLGLLIVAVIRNRDPGGRADPLEIPGKHPKLRWVVAPTVILLAIDLFPLASEAKVIFELAKEPKDALQV